MIFDEWDEEMFVKVQKQISFEEGEESAKITNARNLLKKSNLSAEMIADCCSLPLEQVLALKEELSCEPQIAN